MHCITDWLWANIVFHIVCIKDDDYAITKGGKIRPNRIAQTISNRWP